MIRRLKRLLRSTPPGERYQASELALRRSLRKAGARTRPSPPALTWLDSTLKSSKDVEAALREAEKCGLPLHRAAAKNWDALSALEFALRTTKPGAAVLEVGATFYSTPLLWLYLFGYRDLNGVDLAFDKPTRRGPIRYFGDDLTSTHFDADSFDLIFSMSVIEHGVDPGAYLREMSRLLRPGGALLTSTDYWAEGIPDSDRAAYGRSHKVFARHEIEDLLRKARRLGFRHSEIDLECEEKAVTWDRFDLSYTFLCFALVKQGRPASNRSPQGKSEAI